MGKLIRLLKFSFLHLVIFFIPKLAAYSLPFEIVLGFDLEAEETQPWIFPCQQTMGVLFCNNQLLIEDDHCHSTLIIEKILNTQLNSSTMQISCLDKNKKHLVLAQTKPDAVFRRDDTLPSIPFLSINLNPDIKIETRQAVTGGVIQYVLVLPN